MSWIDTHAHVYVKEFAPDREQMLQRAREAGVGRIYMPNIDITSIDTMLATEEQYPGYCMPMMGLHPCSVKDDFENQLQVVEDWLQKRAFAAVGEMGTDLYWDKSFWRQQQEAFRIQAGWARRFRLPLVIHCRESIEETLALLEPLAGDNLTGIFHCFTGNTDQARRVTDLGFYLGVGGVATFRNGGLDKVLPEVTVDKIVLETDSPYLAPVPYRGKRNEPAYLALVAKRVAAMLGMTETLLMAATSKNAAAVFGDGSLMENL